MIVLVLLLSHCWGLHCNICAAVSQVLCNEQHLRSRQAVVLSGGAGGSATRLVTKQNSGAGAAAAAANTAGQSAALIISSGPRANVLQATMRFNTHKTSRHSFLFLSTLVVLIFAVAPALYTPMSSSG